jgi:hypothetical protein
MNSGRVALGNVGAELGSVILYILYQSFRPATKPNASECFCLILLFVPTTQALTYLNVEMIPCMCSTMIDKILIRV